MDLVTFMTIAGTALTTVTVIYGFVRNIKSDIKNNFDKLDNRISQLDNRIFQLAMGKSLKEILIEEKLQEKK